MQIDVKTTTEPNVIAENPVPDISIITYFGINPSEISKDDISKINEIKSFLSDYGDEFKQFEELRNIKHRLGTPNIGSSEIEHIYKYIKLTRAMKDVEAQVKEMER